MLSLDELVQYLDETLRTQDIPDYAHARNGLQVEREGPIRRVALAVDAALGPIEEAARRGADLIVVHHGVLWGGVQPFVGPYYRRLRALVNANMGLYSSHLPLDVHPELGNNILLARQLGVEIQGTFGDHAGVPVGVWGTVDMRREALAARLDQVLGRRVRIVAGGPERVRTVGVVTGGGASQIPATMKAGLDAFVTGEVAHHNYFDASEGGINLYLGGHYATEVWGVQALGDRLAERFGLETFFIDHPTGL